MKGVQTPHGLKYTLSDDVYNSILNADKGTDIIWNKLNRIIEGRELLPSLVGFIIFCILAFKGYEPWYMVVVFSIVGSIVAYIFRSILFLYKIWIVIILTTVFELFTKFFLDKIAVIVISIFVMKNYYAGIIYVVVGFILSLFLSGSYQRGQHFNDKVAYDILKRL